MTTSDHTTPSPLGAELLAAVYDHMPCGVLITDLQQRILYCNQPFARMLGYEPHELLGRPAAVLSAEEDHERNESAVLGGVLTYGTTWTGNLRGRRKDGSLEVFLVQAARVPAANGRGNLIVELVELEAGHPDDRRALYEAQARYHALLGDIPEAVLVFDPKTLRVLQVNQAAIARYGYSRREWLDLTILDIRPPDQIARTLERLAVMPATHQGLSANSIHRRKDGTTFPVDVYSRLHRIEGRDVVVAVCVDITARVQAEQKHEISERICREVVTHSPYGIIVTMLRSDGRFTVELMNPEAQRP